MLTIQHRYELASRACVQAVAAEAGVNVGLEPYAFDYKHDGTFKRLRKRNGKIAPVGLPLEFQLKASTSWREVGDKIAYDLEAATYNYLVEINASEELPKLLIVFCLPNDGSGWFDVSHDSVQLRRSCYWQRVEGDPTRSTTTQVVRIPKTNHLTAEGLRTLMDWINGHGVVNPEEAAE